MDRLLGEVGGRREDGGRRDLTRRRGDAEGGRKSGRRGNCDGRRGEGDFDKGERGETSGQEFDEVREEGGNNGNDFGGGRGYSDEKNVFLDGDDDG